MTIKILTIVFCLTFACPLAQVTEPNLRELMTPPADTVDAERVRIWMPIEHPQSCLITIKIVDSAGNPVRAFIQRQFSPAYYNFYWDKKDDSGRYVPEGTYSAIIVDVCAPERRSELEVVYAAGELSGYVNQPSARVSDSLIFEVNADSALVTLDLLNRKDIVELVAFTDSLFVKGRHIFSWQNCQPHAPGVYRARITIDGYIRTCPIRFFRKH